jgi:NAD(P)-dependent dehydrogenase (short-subunit alcohol dehydrogenase family)
VDLGLDGQRALVTGSSRGIGLATARGLLEEGCRVLINGLDETRLEQTLGELQEISPHVHAQAADVSTAEGARTLFAAADRRLGGLDVLVNNSGLYRYATPVADISDEEWDDVLRVNLRSVQLCAREALPRMKDAGGGSILNASSFAALVPSVGGGLYAAAKSAVLSLTRTLAAEYAPHGIRVNAYVPGVILTDMTAPLVERRGDAMVDPIALRRVGTIEEAAAPLVFLSSPRASYITGAVLEITGGKLTVQRPDAAWRA